MPGVIDWIESHWRIAAPVVSGVGLVAGRLALADDPRAWLLTNADALLAGGAALAVWCRHAWLHVAANEPVDEPPPDLTRDLKG